MYIRWFKDLTIKDIPSVGGKNASLGEMYGKLRKKGIAVPDGFALTAEAYWKFLRENKLDKKIKEILKNLDVKNVRALAAAGEKARRLILDARLPKELEKEVVEAYKVLGKRSKVKGEKINCAVAVRSSATAEDLPDASFAGQQETYLNVKGEKELLLAVKKCIASLFTNRAISYREAKGFDHMAIALSVGVQTMVRSDLGASGVMFTLDTESGFRGVVLINASYGLGEYVVKGRVTPDQFYVFKDGVKKGYNSVISRRLGSKEVKLVYADEGKRNKVKGERTHQGTRQEKVNIFEQKKFCLTDEEVLKLARWGMQIEEHYRRPMDIEWAKDGRTGELYIVQARSETVKSRVPTNTIETYKLGRRGKVIVTGSSVGQRIGQGHVRIISSPKQMKQFKHGEILVTRLTDPDWEPIMRIASAIVTEQGGKTSHAAIVSRELGIPCIVGAAKARQLLKNGEEVTVSCAEGEAGYVYKGRLPFEVEKTEVKILARTKTKIMMNVGEPDSAFYLSSIPNDGVGLAREEFIFTNFIKIHPLALVNYEKTKNPEIKKAIDALTVGYKDKKQYGIDRLAEGMAFIASAFHPNDVIVRLSDFKTNEYATLIGGEAYEPKEENPMIGWRGASRYYDPKYKPGFKLECAAIKKAREEWGLKNIIVMVPFCRTVEEGKRVLATMKEFGLERGKDGLKVYVMCEIPSNVILAKEFCSIFDGFSIGSNDLTQLTLGVDRDSALVSHVYDENNLAVKKLIRDVIQTAHKYGRKVGICGQAPSDYPEFAEFLVQEGIDSISLNPDTVLKTRQRIADMEKKVGSGRKKNFNVLSKAALAVVVLVGMLAMGGACQVIGNQQQVSDDIKSQIAAEVLKVKLELAQQLKQQKESEKNTYSEDSFVKFTLQYPAKWQVDHGDEYIYFSGYGYTGANGAWFHVVKQKVFVSGDKHLDVSEFTTTTWQGYKARKFFIIEDEAGWQSNWLEVYPPGYKKGADVITFSGDPKHFDEILNSIKDFVIKK